KGELEVIVGSLKMKVKDSQVAFLRRAAPVESGQTTFRPTGLKSASVRPEIDVRGQNIDEAIATLDKYIDEVLSSSLDKVRIIHGKGTGALRKGLHDYFSAHPHIASFELAAYNEGGAGATVITVR
ncbi:MAG: Smr/MutS family protein, partial [Bacillota bacterium]|nr:Smr/MutS family protein [Bacillota bacterium]